MCKKLIEQINAALSQIDRMADQQFGPAISIQRQLRWCKNYLLNLPNEHPPGKFSMGLIAIREFDMWGDQPELASLINSVQGQIERLMSNGRKNSPRSA